MVDTVLRCRPMVNKDKERTVVEDRIAALEARTETLEERLRSLEADGAVAEIAAGIRRFERPSTPPPVRVVPAPAPAPTPRPVRRQIDLEEFLGGSVLAWLGGVAVLAGLAFLLTIAVSRGWLGEGARTALAGALSLGLLAVGVRLRERRGRNDAALSAAAAGIAGAFGTLVVAGPVYDLVPTALALLGALAVGGTATALAVRWRAQVMGWIGLTGALLAPSVLGASFEGGGIPYLVVAYAATVAVLVWQRWTALGFAAFALGTPQWLFWLYWDEPGTAPTLALLVVFGALTTVAAIGFELRRRDEHVRKSAAALLVLNALVLAAAGWDLLDSDAWLVAIAAAHLAVGLAGNRIPRVSRELALIALGLGIVLGDVALAALTSGLPLALAWTAGAVGFGALLKRAAVRSDRVFALAGLGGHLLSALTHAVVLGSGGSGDAGSLLAIAAVATGAAISGRLAADYDPRIRVALDALALALVAYLSALALDGAALALAFAGEAAVLAGIARKEHDRVAAYGSIAFASLALSWTLIDLAAPGALYYGLDDATAGAAGLAASAGAALLAARAFTGRVRAALLGTAAVVALYLLSVETVTLAGAGLTAQTLLSVLWAATGVGTLVAGLLLDRRDLRRAALVLLTITVTKVFFYDLASLTSLYRVGSLIGLGLLLLCGGFAWQRYRPLPLPDLREAGPDAR
jgi:uncharacterized membrane protein